jgi:hypothetical protein
MLGRSTEAYSHLPSLLPLVDYSASTLDTAVQDTDQTAKWFPMLWIRLCLRIREQLMGGEFLLILHQRSFNQNIICHSESVGPQIISNCFGPSLVAMNEHCSCEFLKDSNSSFGNPILMVCHIVTFPEWDCQFNLSLVPK